MTGTTTGPGRAGESELIVTYFAPLATHEGAFDLRDDAAALRPPPRHDLVMTADMLVADVHFIANDPPSAIAKKALRVNLSDLAAKGAAPMGYLLSLALPRDWSEQWLAGFTLGLRDDQARFGISLLGGDTVMTPGPLTISVTAVGSVPRGRMVKRFGAKAGDILFVTGCIGDAALGLVVHAQKGFAAAGRIGEAERAYLAGRYLFPEPRLGLGEAMRAHAHAAMDVSDGLAGDLAKMCRASGTSADVEAALVPLSDAARALCRDDAALFERALTGGDDYELLIAVPPRRAARFTAAAQAAGLPVTRIGAMRRGQGDVAFLDSRGNVMTFAVASYEHF